jgi:catechol 2,3-dioxygenase-like lactoylglutathione lyase family enzyme
MSITIGSIGLWVHDQEVALDFWTNKVGFEVRGDLEFAELPGVRWLTVGPKDQPDVEITLLSIPGEPVFTAEQQSLVATMLSQGISGGGLILLTDDVQRDYDTLSARGVEFTEKPEQRPYGIDCGFRDPSGNHMRLTQLTDAF